VGTGGGLEDPSSGLFVNPVVLGAGTSMFKAVDGALKLTPESREPRVRVFL
jgi:hypothetical protein